MMKREMVLALVVCLAGSVLTAMATEPIKSGPQAGEKVGGPFEPLNVNGENAGKKHCLYCENKMRPAVMIFVREPSTQALQLIVNLEAAAARLDRPIGAYVIFCTDDDTLAGRLEAWAKAAKLSKVILAVYHSDGPKEYHLAKDADVTALLYNRNLVKANHSFRKGELTDQTGNAIFADLPKILTQD